MQNFTRGAAILALAISTTACVQDDEGNFIPEPVTVSATAIDYFSGVNVSDATITLTWTTESGVASYTATTDALGAATVYYPEDATDLTVYSDATSYAEYGRSVSNDIESTEVQLVPVDASVTFNNSESNELLVDNDVLIVLPADAFASEDGSSYSGSVIAEITVIDPRMDPELMPGNYQTIDESTGEIANIESFGAINATFETPDGQSLQVAEGQNVEIRIPLAGTNATAPTTIPLYYYNDDSGFWIEEGEAVLTEIEGGWFYIGTVTHFTTWNADQVYNTVNVHGCVNYIDGTSANGAIIRSTGVNYLGTSNAYADESGQFSIPVRMNSQLLLQASEGTLVSSSTSVATSGDDLTLDSCLIVKPAELSIQLNWGATPRDLDAHFEGPDFHLYYANSSVTQGEDTAFIDTDATSGFGPETIYMSGFSTDGIYTYSVYHFSGEDDIASSPARVSLKLGSINRVYAPPAGTATECWEVFQIEVVEGIATVTETGIWTDRASCYGSGDDGGFEGPVNDDPIFAASMVGTPPVDSPKPKK